MLASKQRLIASEDLNVSSRKRSQLAVDLSELGQILLHRRDCHDFGKGIPYLSTGSDGASLTTKGFLLFCNERNVGSFHWASVCNNDSPAVRARE